jgi:shikimate kinase
MRTPLRPIIITAFMGSGKTTVARALARELTCEMVDLDELITNKAQRTARQIIEEDGEPAFREVESHALCEVLENGFAGVIALGGGAWTLQRNRDLINEYRGITVWLEVPFELCWERILASGGERPLAPDELQARMLYAERRADYALAQLHIAAGRDKLIDEISAEIAEALRLREKIQGPHSHGTDAG